MDCIAIVMYECTVWLHLNQLQLTDMLRTNFRGFLALLMPNSVKGLAFPGRLKYVDYIAAQITVHQKCHVVNQLHRCCTDCV